jgi:hypothetical protein
MLSRRVLACLLCVFAGAAQALAQTASCSFDFFETPKQFVATFINGINRYGNIVGTGCGNEDPNGCFDDRGYIRYSGGGVKILLAPNSIDTQFTRRNASGVTVGQSTDSKGTHGIVNYNGTWRTVDFPGAVSTSLTGINMYGSMVGNWSDSKGHSHGFELKNGKFTSISAPGANTNTYAQSISDTGVIVGSYDDPDAAVYTNGFVVKNGVLTTVDHPNGTTSLWDINAKDVIVGDNDGHPFILKNGSFYDVWVQGSNSVTIRGINGYGKIVGNAYFGLPSKGYIGTCSTP